jgi:hypothetical protein
MMSVPPLFDRWLSRHSSRRLAPDVEHFLQWLAATPYSWGVQADGRLRADDHGTVLCAVTAVARHREALAFSVGDWVRAGDSLGLSYASAGLIVDAADGRTTSPRLKMLRDRMLLAARIATAGVRMPSVRLTPPRRPSGRHPGTLTTTGPRG